MSALEKINLFFSVFLDGLKSLKKPVLWLPFLFYALIQFLLLLALVYFYSPLLSTVFIPLVKGFVGDFALHYPGYFLFLPKIFSRGNLLLGGILGIIFIGWATHLFFSYFLPDRKAKLGEGLKVTFSKYFLLLGVWLIETLVLLGWFYLIPRIGKGLLTGGFKRELAFEILSLGLGIVFYCFFAYAFAAIVISGKNILSGLGSSVSIYRRNFFSTYFFVLIPNLLTFPFTLLNHRAALLISKFNPEVIFLILILEIGVSMIANYILISTLTRFYLYDQGLD
ncbi:MAG: hypothetical protein Q8O10_04730 [candidate division Zixibacteria bacterium]|nr:hypothetical protein [candidate division Zixibacteria bacterium]